MGVVEELALANPRRNAERICDPAQAPHSRLSPDGRLVTWLLEPVVLIGAQQHVNKGLVLDQSEHRLRNEDFKSGCSRMWNVTALKMLGVPLLESSGPLWVLAQRGPRAYITANANNIISTSI